MGTLNLQILDFAKKLRFELKEMKLKKQVPQSILKTLMHLRACLIKDLGISEIENLLFQQLELQIILLLRCLDQRDTMKR
jgi:hypothetical protein